MAIKFCEYIQGGDLTKITVYANYIGPSVMTYVNKVEPVKGSLYVMIKLLKMTNVS